MKCVASVLAMAACLGLTAYDASAFPPMPAMVVDVTPDTLTRDAVYIGSMTLAGLAVFGSSFMVRVARVTKEHSTTDKIAASLVSIFLVLVAGIHVGLAGVVSGTDPTYEILEPFLQVTLVSLGAIIVAYGWIRLSSQSGQSQSGQSQSGQSQSNPPRQDKSACPNW